MSIKKQTVPQITDVKDEQGRTIDNGGTTSSAELTLSGLAIANEVVIVWDGTVFFGSASVSINGTWRKTLIAPELRAYNFTIRALDETESLPWVVVVDAGLALPAPTVVEAEGDVLDPMNAVLGARVVVKYEGMVAADEITLKWDGEEDLVSSQPGNPGGSVTFNVPASEVGGVLGKIIDVSYSVERNGTSKSSQILELEVQSLPDSVLLAPKIRQAPDDLNLDVRALSTDADLFVPVWPFIAAGQHISLGFEGVRPDGSAYNWVHETWNDLPITSGAEPTTNTKLSDLQQLKDGSALKLIFEVSFDGGMTKLAFPVRVLTVAVLEPDSGFEDFDDEQQGPLPSWAVTFSSGLVFTMLMPSNPRPEIGRDSGDTVLFSGSSVSTSVNEFRFAGGATDIRISYKTSRGHVAWVIFRAPEVEAIEMRDLEPDTDGDLVFRSPRRCHLFDLMVRAPSGDKGVVIRSIEWA